MKFLHLADLHLGKKVNDISMIDEQKNALSQACELVEEQEIDFVVISGDVFDRAIAPVSALNLFNDFINNLINTNTKVFIIAGNHDNPERLSYFNSVLKSNGICISNPYEGKIESFSFDNINIYLMPYLELPLIKKYYPDSDISSYNDGIKCVIEDIEIDKTKINILLAHQFVTGENEPVVSDSEQKNVGGVENISYEIFKKFDYTALGHLHCPQKVGCENIRYSGSIVKYSFSEINHKKSFCVVQIDDNKNVDISLIDIKPIREYREYRGYIKEFLDEEFYSKVDINDYIHFILLDEDVIDAKRKLDLIYPNIMLLEFDNSFTRNLSSSFDIVQMKDKSIFEHFQDFYIKQEGSELDSTKEKIVLDIIEKIKSGEDGVNASS